MPLSIINPKLEKIYMSYFFHYIINPNHLNVYQDYKLMHLLQINPKMKILFHFYLQFWKTQSIFYFH